MLQWKSNNYYTTCVFFCSLRYPASNVNAPFCHLWHTSLYNIFPCYLINSMIIKKKLLNIKCVFRFSVQILSETFFLLRRFECNMIKNVYLSSCTGPFILERLQWNLNFMDNLKQNLKYQISWKSVQWETSCSMWTDRRTDRQIWWS